MYIYPPSIHKREKESKSLSALASLYALIRRLVALCVCSWDSGGFQLFKCGYPYLCKNDQLQGDQICLSRIFARLSVPFSGILGPVWPNLPKWQNF